MGHKPSVHGDNNKYEWDFSSAFRKAKADLDLSFSLGFISLQKRITGPYNPETDAYCCCAKCGRHKNYHKNGKCPILKSYKKN